MNPRPLIRCDCKVINGGTNYYAERIVFCPLHGSADELLEVCKLFIKALDREGSFVAEVSRMAAKTIARAEGKQ